MCYRVVPIPETYIILFTNIIPMNWIKICMLKYIRVKGKDKNPDLCNHNLQKQSPERGIYREQARGMSGALKFEKQWTSYITAAQSICCWTQLWPHLGAVSNTESPAPRDLTASEHASLIPSPGDSWGPDLYVTCSQMQMLWMNETHLSNKANGSPPAPPFSLVAFKGRGEGRVKRRAASADMPIIYNHCCCPFGSDGKFTTFTKRPFSLSGKHLMFSRPDWLPGWGMSPPARHTLDVSRHSKTA